MRRFLMLILCCALLTGTVFAAGQADEVRNTTVVYTDGSADVVLTVSLTLTEIQKDLTFPLPRDVENVRLNDQSVDTSASRENPGVVLVDLGSLCTQVGSYNLVFRYSLPAVISYGEPIRVKVEPEATEATEGETETTATEPAKEEYKEIRPLELELPLLSGFEYPVDALNFSVTFPEGVEESPMFESGYLLQSIESVLEYKMEDGILTGTVTKPMKDKETLLLSMTVEAKDFPELKIVEDGEYTYIWFMVAAAGLALLYWLLFLPSRPVVPFRTNTVPAGIHAGEVASWLSMEGADLTMMVFQWAQLGYLRISPDRRGHVWLRKRMAMGNERSAFEVQTFRHLFGSNESVDGTGSRYARLYHHVSNTMDSAVQITRGGLGGRKVFRGIAVLATTFCGAAMGQKLGLEGYWQIAAMMGLAMIGCVVGWKIQSGAACLHLRRKDALSAGILWALVWLVAATFCGRFLGGVISIAIQILAGIFAAWGGRRTVGGWQVACQLLGLRHYLTGMKRAQAQFELDRNPDYFFELAPYALAFGVEDGFAKRFGCTVMPQCGYLDAGRADKRTAAEWAYVMRQTVEKLDNSAKRVNQYRR